MTAKAAQEIETLESAVKRLESDLSTARQAESYLEIQKQENLQLKETIDRMRYELDEARGAAALGGVHTRGTTTSGISMPGTVSKSLGAEIERRLVQLQDQRDEAEEEEGDGSIIETVVTTQRRVSIDCEWG